MDSPSPLPVRRWLHLATVYDLAKRNMRIYLDGWRVAQQKIEPRPLQINPQQDLYIGQYGGADE